MQDAALVALHKRLVLSSGLMHALSPSDTTMHLC
jgi:hypothetical protein